MRTFPLHACLRTLLYVKNSFRNMWGLIFSFIWLCRGLVAGRGGLPFGAGSAVVLTAELFVGS